MAKPTTLKEAIKKFEETSGKDATSAEKVRSTLVMAGARRPPYKFPEEY